MLPDTVIEHDIDPVVDLETAHERYERDSKQIFKIFFKFKTKRKEIDSNFITVNINNNF